MTHVPKCHVIHCGKEWNICLAGGAFVLEPKLDLQGTHAKPLAKVFPEFRIWIRAFLEHTTYNVNENGLVHIFFDR